MFLAASNFNSDANVIGKYEANFRVISLLRKYKFNKETEGMLYEAE